MFTGFIFNRVDLSRFNLAAEIVSVLLPFGLWCGVNWALTTLMDGKGTIRDVYVATSYALVPLVFTVIPVTVISNFITQEEGSLLYGLPMLLGMGWTGILVFFGAVMTTHEHDFQKTALTSVLTLAGMVFAMFLALLFADLVEQVIGFANELVTEIVTGLDLRREAEHIRVFDKENVPSSPGSMAVAADHEHLVCGAVPSGFELVSENEHAQLYVKMTTAEIAVLSKADGSVWFSNPPDRATMETFTRGCSQRQAHSPAYHLGTTRSTRNSEMDSYNDCVKHGQFKIAPIRRSAS